MVEPTDEGPVFWRESESGGCCSTGKKLHSFFNRMQFTHRPWASEGDGMHLIFRRRQCPSPTFVSA